MDSPGAIADMRRPGRAKLSGAWLVLARIAVAATAVVMPAAFAVSLPARYDELRHGMASGGPTGAVGMPGFSDGAAAYLIGLEVAVALGFLAVALAIFVRRSDDRPAALAAVTLAAFGVALPGTTFAIVRARPVWEVSFPPAQALGWALLLIFAYTFPDGRFRPRWTRPLAAIWVAWVSCFFLAGQALAASRPWLIGLAFAVWVAWFATGALAQAYRYVRLASYAERQQTKWVVLGFVGAITGTLVAALPGIASLSLGSDFAFTSSATYLLGAATLASVAALLIPLTIGIAILRHRLFDVDLIIHRALVYGLLTGALATFYACCILGAQLVLTGAVSVQGEPPSSPVLVVSTLATIALFRPLRRRIQVSIDRRFYRRHYDAARVVTSFSDTVRGQVELPELRQRLLSAVEETMRPAHASLWLRDLPARPEVVPLAHETWTAAMEGEG